MAAAARHRSGRWSAALVLTLGALSASCGSVPDPAGFSIVAQDRFDFASCPEIVAARKGQEGRVRDLTGLVEKAESSPGGILVGYVSYRSELLQARALLAATQRAERMKACDAQKG